MNIDLVGWLNLEQRLLQEIDGDLKGFGAVSFGIRYMAHGGNGTLMILDSS